MLVFKKFIENMLSHTKVLEWIKHFKDGHEEVNDLQRAVGSADKMQNLWWFEF